MSEITSQSIEAMSKVRTIKVVNISNNLISKVSKEIQILSDLEEIWMSGNPIHCDCEIIWMITWLNALSNSTNNNLIKDNRDVKCSNGKLKGVPVMFLSDVLLGCFPSKWTRGQKAAVGVFAGVMCIAVCLAAIVAKKTREVKFFMFYYLRLDTVPRDDKSENLDNIENDAYLCYW